MTINKTFKLILLHPTSIERWSDKIISNRCHASWFIFRLCLCVLLGFIKTDDVQNSSWAGALLNLPANLH